jgi:S1-C subfamily serine protease
MFKFIIGGILGMALGMSMGAAKADEVADFQREAINPVVQLERNCSGSVVNTSDKAITYILTANHCLEEGLKVKSGHINIDVKEENSSKINHTNTYVYDIVTRSIPNDLAVLKLRDKNLNLDGVTIGTEDPQVGEDVWTVGFPMGFGKLITGGKFAGYDNLDLDTYRFDDTGNGLEVYRASPAIVGGNSGGAFFVKRDGHYQQVGVTFAGFPTYFVYGLYHTQKQINEILKNAMNIESKTDTPKIEQAKKND